MFLVFFTVIFIFLSDKLVLYYIFDAVPNMMVKRSDVVRAVIVRTSKGLKRESGMMLRFDENAAVLINTDGSPRGTMSFIFSFSLSFLFLKIIIFIP